MQVIKVLIKLTNQRSAVAKKNPPTSILFYHILSDKGNLSAWEWLWGLQLYFTNNEVFDDFSPTGDLNHRQPLWYFHRNAYIVEVDNKGITWYNYFMPSFDVFNCRQQSSGVHTHTMKLCNFFHFSVNCMHTANGVKRNVRIYNM